MPESESSGLSPRYDRGREELFRRMVESVCTRGNVFTVYAVGQSIAQTPSCQKTATATARLRLTFELVPVWDPPLPETDSVPLESDRIRPPSSYKVRILAAGP